MGRVACADYGHGAVRRLHDASQCVLLTFGGGSLHRRRLACAQRFRYVFSCTVTRAWLTPISLQGWLRSKGIEVIEFAELTPKEVRSLIGGTAVR